MVSGFDSDHNSELIQVEIQKIWSFLPKPVLAMLPFHIDKDFVNSGSGGDHIYSISGAKDVLGGMRTGSLVAILFSIFGWFYPIWIGMTVIIVYILCDSYVLNKGPEGIYGKGMFLSALVLISMYPITFMLTSAASGSETYSSIIGFIIRGYLQMGILYMALFWTTRLVMSKRLTAAE